MLQYQNTRKAFPVEDGSTEKKTEAPTVSPSKSDTVKAPGKAVISKARNIKGKTLNVKWKKVPGKWSKVKKVKIKK